MDLLLVDPSTSVKVIDQALSIIPIKYVLISIIHSLNKSNIFLSNNKFLSETRVFFLHLYFLVKFSLIRGNGLGGGGV